MFFWWLHITYDTPWKYLCSVLWNRPYETAVKAVQDVCANAVTHHHFKERLRGDNEFNDLVSLPVLVGWATKGFTKFKYPVNSNSRFSGNKRNACQMFINQKKKAMWFTYFLINVTLHINKINLKLQGKENIFLWFS